MTTDIDLHDAQVKLASAQRQYEALQAEEKHLAEVRRQLATSKEQTQQALSQLKTANEQAVRNRIEAENAAMILQAAEAEKQAAELAAELAAKRAQAEAIADDLAEIEAAAEKADALLLGYAEQLAIISKAKRRASQQLTQNFSGYHVNVPHPGMEAEVREAQFKTNELHLTNNAINDAGTFAGTQGRAGQYVSLARVIIAPHLSGAK